MEMDSEMAQLQDAGTDKSQFFKPTRYFKEYFVLVSEREKSELLRC
jgi:hypothetical protein